MDWHIEVDEAMFLGGLPKGEFLREFEPDFFFDDQTGHVENAVQHVPAGHVAAGVANASAGAASSSCVGPPRQPLTAGRHRRAGAARSSTRTPPYSMRISAARLQRAAAPR